MEKVKTKIFYILTLIFLIVVISCDTAEPPNENQSINLILEDVSCTEAWITLTTTNIQLPTTVTLKQNDQFHSTINLVKADTLLYIDSLFPNQAYQFQSVIQSINQSSNEISVNTMDTTSQNFTFEILEFGDGFSSSYFNDVWIFNPDDIWLCGNVFTNDSTDGNLYHWNGSYWKAHRLNFVDMEGIWGIDTIMYLASGGLWIYDRDTLIRQNIQGNFEPGQAVHKLWGSSLSNIYGVGPWGTIVYYNGVRWTKIDFDTQWYFYNITGNKETGVAYAVAINQVDDCIIVKIDNSNISIFYQKSLSDIKVSSRTITELNNYLYISGFYYQNLICRLNDKEDIKTIHVLPLTLGVRQSFALQSNDIFYAGEENSEARLVHFNGVNYKIFDIPQIDPDNYGGIHAIKDLAVSAGFTNNKAYLIIVRRSP
jgi:hypothetical protein